MEKLLGTLAVGVLAVVSLLLHRLLNSPLRHLPGPWDTNVTNIRLKIATLTGRKIYYIDDLHKRYGRIVRISPDQVDVTDDAEGHKLVYNITNGWRKAKWYQSFTISKRLGIFAEPVPKLHAERRRLLAQPFSKSSLREHWEPTVRSLAELAVRQIKAEAKREGTADVLKWWTLLANDVACMLMFGESMGQLETGETTPYIKDLQTALIALSVSYEFPLIPPIARMLPFKGMFKDTNSFLEYGKRAIVNARTGGTKANIFTNIITKADGNDGKLDERDVSAEAANLLIAASDTTSNALTFMTWAIMKRPQIHAELEQELQQLPEGFRDADLEKLPLLNAVIEESLRLYGGCQSGLPREVPAGGAILCGYALPPGIAVTMQAYTMHRSATFFDNPETFDPSRFLRPLSPETKAVYVPFGSGSRICIGIHMARMELRYAIALLFRPVAGADKRLTLAKSVTDESMEMQEFFLTTPVSHRCEVQLENTIVS